MFSHDIIKKRILIVGSNGMLGQSLCRFYSRQKNSLFLACSIEDKSFINGFDYVQCDITKRNEVKKVVLDFYPDYIVNASAYTNVDKSETEREQAWKVNVKGVEYLAEAARILDARIIHISTDYVFDGKDGPYTEDEKPNPLGYYARTKLASENALRISGVLHTILRTNVLYGADSNGKTGFVRWLINALRDGKDVRIVTDQVNNPTFVDDLVQAISKVIEYNKTGVYNIGGKEFLTRFQFSEIIADYFGLNKNMIKPITTEELNQPARRPLKSGLITLKAETELGYKPHSIKETLAIIKKELYK
ncbi:MAG: dTDP-4-dehydrorhamnose reductase [Ignavibacteria bacterium GWA2_35_9]|nr:MAG: dTDP-4-dehydrorhamnose reductase [Ignavibacteria bacterium GWA2_35_9]OGU46176.1 MAG: dTDP-4-dehydrorhamnose reductase [Ignavibacteria bacterium GWB2_36_8]OGU48495.1 MAG: dTDP-4-dehydrorhamnose reductase [Ignavibacteria bacterium GWC2_36_12]